MSWKSLACIALAVSLVFGAAGCGSQSLQGGFGSFNLTSVAPNPVPGMIPTLVTITGGDFSNQIGATVEVEWIADTGTPFLGGTSQTATTIGTITSATTIDTVTPRVVICGPVSITATIRVTLPSGVWAQSAAGFITFTAPTVTSFAGGGIFPAAIPTAFILNGTGFGDIGSPVTIHWSSPSAIFDAGASTTTTTSGTVASNTTIAGTSPLALVCGPAAIGASVTRVSFQDGSCTPTGTNVPALFVAPTITGVLNTGGGLDNGTNGFAAAIPESFQVNGTGYGPLGGTATINMTSANPIFVNGTSTTTSVQGTIVSPTQIDVAASALAAMCAPGFVTDNVTFEVTLPDGACTPTGGGVIGVYNAPQITTIVNIGGRAPDNGTNNFAAAIPERFLINGTRLGVAGDQCRVQWLSAAGTSIYQNGASPIALVQASVVSATQIIGDFSPEALMCAPGLTVDAQNVDVFVNGGSCSPLSVLALMNAPSFTQILNTQVGSPWNGSNRFGAAVPESFTLTGDRFGPIGGIAIVRWQDNGGLTPYSGGTTATTTVLGQIISPTTIVGVSPEAALCSTATSSLQNILVTLEGGSCTQNALNAAILLPSTVTAIANTDRGGALFFSAIPETFVLTGTEFGPVGGTAVVRFTVDAATAAGTAATPFAGGTSAFVDVLATVTSRTTIEGTSPLSLLCPIPGVDPATQLTAGIDLSVTMEGGTCTETDAPLNVPVLFLGPSLRTADLLVPTPPATGIAGGPPLVVPTTVPVGQDEMPEFRLTGTGFAPLGAIALVTFTDIGNGAGGADLNGGTTITVPAFVVSENVIEGELPVIDMARLTQSEIVRTTVTLAPNGSCTFDDALVSLTAPPTITLVTNLEANTGNGLLSSGFAAADVFACENSFMRINGSGFIPSGVLTDTDVLIFDTNSGLDPITDQPVRRFGTGTPPDNFGFFTDFGLFASKASNVLQGHIRTDALTKDLDTDDDGLVSYTVRVINNPDGQYHDFVAGNVRLTSATVNPTGGASGNIRNNNSVAVNPVSFTDDWNQAFPADTTDFTDGVNVVAISNDEVPGGGFGLFNGTDILLMRSVDGGRTFTSGPLGASAIDGIAAGAARSFAKVAYDTFGNLAVAYIVDDFGGINFDTHHVMLRSTDNGATWALDGFAITGGPFSAGLWNNLDLSVGPSWNAGAQQFLTAWVDSTGQFLPGDNLQNFRREMTALGAGAVGVYNFAGVNDAPPPFGIAGLQCAVGNSGELYLAWQEPQFGGPPPFTTNFMFDVAFGALFPTWGVDQLAFTDFIPFFALPAYSDIQFFEPVMDMCVARAGANAGRILWVYDHIYPNGGLNPVDHAGVLARISDAPGGPWSLPVSTHAVDMADRFIPAVCSDRVTGRFYVSWYDTTSSIAAGNTTFERYGSASDDGVSWGLARNLSGARGPSMHPFDFDTDFGAYAGIDAHNGSVYATWSDTVDSGGALGADPVVVGYQQK